MNSNARSSYLNRLQSLAEHAIGQAFPQSAQGITWIDGERTLSLTEGNAREFLALIGELSQRDVWSERASEKFIQERLVPVLRSFKDGDPDRAASAFDAFVLQVEQDTVERTCYVPVDQIVLAHGPIQVGRVTFRVIDETAVEEAVDCVLSTPSPASGVSAVEWVDFIREQLKEHLLGRVCAEFGAIGEPGRLRERAVQETRRALELITCANAAMYPHLPQGNSVASLSGEIPAVSPLIPVFAPGAAHTSITASERSYPIEISRSSLEAYERTGFWVLADLLEQPVQSLTEFEEALLRGAHWIAVAQTRDELETRLLNLMTAIEVLVGPKGDPVRVAIAEGVALLAEETYDARLELKKFISGLYDARSKLSHGGKKAVTESDVLRIRSIASELLAKLAHWKTRIRTKQELLELLEKARLSGARIEPSPLPGQPLPLADLRNAKGLTIRELADMIPRKSIDAAAVERFEQRMPGPIELRFVADALDVRPELIALPRSQRWVRSHDHLYHLTATRKGPGSWESQVTGWDFKDATAWPLRLLDPSQPDRDGPSVITEWTCSGLTAEQALRNLEEKIHCGWDRALSPERLPDDPPDWTPQDTPEHWLTQIEQVKNRGR